MAKIKKKEAKIVKQCTECFKSKHILFSFAYLVYNQNVEKNDIEALYNRMKELSSVSYMQLSLWDKYKGFEEVRVEIKKEIPNNFQIDIAEFDGKYTVIRLYKNNNPTKGRIIGKIINKVFYIFYIDAKGILYKH